MMTADEVEGGVELFMVKAVIAFETDVEADDVIGAAGGGEAGEGVKCGDGVAHADAVEFPEEGVAGAGVGDDVLGGGHAAPKIRVSGGWERATDLAARCVLFDA